MAAALTDALFYYQLASGLDGFAPASEVQRMKDVRQSRKATPDETQDYMDLTTLNPFLACA